MDMSELKDGVEFKEKDGTWFVLLREDGGTELSQLLAQVRSCRQSSASVLQISWIASMAEDDKLYIIGTAISGDWMAEHPTMRAVMLVSTRKVLMLEGQAILVDPVFSDLLEQFNQTGEKDTFFSGLAESKPVRN
jgi:hypothetical protein